MKKALILSAAVLSLAACSNEDFIGENSSQTEAGTPVSFSITSKGTSRADAEGADAAALLGNKFVVDGSKGKGDAGYADNVVFDQYNVAWTQNTAQTSQSNSDNWEYVGLDVNANSKVAAQTIKYWDYSTDVYDFIAWSAGVKEAIYGDATLADGKVKVSAINRDNIGNATSADPVYTVTGKAADLANFYISDVNTVKNANYGAPVKIDFRSLASKIRVGFYETVPGYSIEKIEFYTAEKSTSTTATDATTNASLYASDAVFSQDGTMSVWYPIVGTENEGKAAYNEAVVKLDATASTGKKDLEFGTITYNTLKEKAEDAVTTPNYAYIGRSASAPTFIGNAEDNYYKLVVPTGEGNVLNLRVNYTLVSIDGSGEEIYVKGATAQVPAVYTSWLPNYAYTYLFKISDNTNGYTGPSTKPAGLYPITFDAVVVNAENASFQETVTTVATNTITTYQYGQKVTENNEYVKGTDVYAMVNGGTTAMDNTSTPKVGNATTYVVTVPSANTTRVPGTEADIIDALKVQASNVSGVITGRNGLVLTPATGDEAVKLNEATTELKAEDGSTYTLAENTVAIFKPATTGKLAFVYTAAVDVTTTDDAQYEAKAMTVGTSVVGMYKYKTNKCADDAKYVIGTTYYKNEACTEKVDASAFIAGVTSVKDYYTIDKTLANLVEIKAPTAAGADPEKAIAGVTYFVKYNYYKDADYSVKVLTVKE